MAQKGYVNQLYDLLFQQSLPSETLSENNVEEIVKKPLIPPTIVVHDFESGAEGDLEAEREDLEDMNSVGLKAANGPASSSSVLGVVSKATIAVSDVDGRAFDILLRYKICK